MTANCSSFWKLMTPPDRYNELKKAQLQSHYWLTVLHCLRSRFIPPDACFISLFYTDGFKSEVNYKTLKLEVCGTFR